MGHDGVARYPNRSCGPTVAVLADPWSPLSERIGVGQRALTSAAL